MGVACQRFDGQAPYREPGGAAVESNAGAAGGWPPCRRRQRGENRWRRWELGFTSSSAAVLLLSRRLAVLARQLGRRVVSEEVGRVGSTPRVAELDVRGQQASVRSRWRACTTG